MWSMTRVEFTSDSSSEEMRCAMDERDLQHDHGVSLDEEFFFFAPLFFLPPALSVSWLVTSGGGTLPEDTIAARRRDMAAS